MRRLVALVGVLVALVGATSAQASDVPSDFAAADHPGMSEGEFGKGFTAGNKQYRWSYTHGEYRRYYPGQGGWEGKTMPSSVVRTIGPPAGAVDADGLKPLSLNDATKGYVQQGAGLSTVKTAKPSLFSRLKSGMTKSGLLGPAGLLVGGASLVAGANEIACSIAGTTDYCFNVRANTAAAGPGTQVAPTVSPLHAQIVTDTGAVLPVVRNGSTWSPMDTRSSNSVSRPVTCGPTVAESAVLGSPVSIPRADLTKYLPTGLDAGAAFDGCRLTRSEVYRPGGVYLAREYASSGAQGNYTWTDEQIRTFVAPTRGGSAHCTGMPLSAAQPYRLYRCNPSWSADQLIEDLQPVERPTSPGRTFTPESDWPARLLEHLSDGDDFEGDLGHLALGVDPDTDGDGLPGASKVKILAPKIGETYATYVARLRAAGLTGTITRVELDTTTMNLVAGPSAVAGVTPSAGSEVARDAELTVKVNPATAPDPAEGTKGDTLPDTGTASGDDCSGDACAPPGTFNVGPLKIPTPCNVMPFGVPCWMLDFMQSWGAQREAPHWTLPGTLLGAQFSAAPIVVDLDVVTPVATAVRTLLIGLGTISMAWFFFGLTTGKPTGGAED